jgi:hypothetical protein
MMPAWKQPLLSVERERYLGRDLGKLCDTRAMSQRLMLIPSIIGFAQ